MDSSIKFFTFFFAALFEIYANRNNETLFFAHFTSCLCFRRIFVCEFAVFGKSVKFTAPINAYSSSERVLPRLHQLPNTIKNAKIASRLYRHVYQIKLV